MIEVESLSHSFGSRQVLENLSFRVEQGEIFGLVGPDGAGKTTLVRALTGILEPKAGWIRTLGSPRPETVRKYVSIICTETCGLGEHPPFRLHVRGGFRSGGQEG